MKKTKLQILTRRLVTVFISIILVWGIVLSVSIINKTSNLNVVCSEVDGYYSETTYFSNEYDYEKYCQEKANRENPKTKTAKLANSIETSNEEFVAAAVKSVWVSETVDKSGNTLDSHLMTKAEIDKFDAPKENVDESTVLTDASVDPYVSLGSDDTGIYYLDIVIRVAHNTETDEYTITGSAFWEEKLVWYWQTDMAAEESYFDFMGVTWGGGDTICSVKTDISGKYYNDQNVIFGKRDSHDYRGYVWQFHEKSGYLGKEMRSGVIKSNIKKEGEKLGQKTCAQLTYIHTYGAFDNDFSLEIEASESPSVAAGIAMSVVKKSWQLQVSVDGIIY